MMSRNTISKKVKKYKKFVRNIIVDMIKNMFEKVEMFE